MPLSVTHKIELLARIDGFVSLNSAIEVDLSGQVNAEVAGGTYIGAVGGQVDYVRAARRSRGGKSIIALPATARSGKVSRIVASLNDPVVTTARSDVDIVATEYGAAHLRGMSLEERARRLIAIAHPDFREPLERHARAAFGPDLLANLHDEFAARYALMKFGTFITKQRGEAIAADVRQAEQLGFESAWIAEHLIMPVKQTSAYPYTADGRFLVPPDAPFHDPLLTLAYVAALTTKIRLATGIFVVPLRNAFATAKAIATLDQLSQGRVIFGVGIGWLKEEFEAVGMKFEDRALRTREYLECDDRAVEQERSALQGQDGCDPGDEVHAQDRPAAASTDRLRRHQRARAQAHRSAGRRMVRDRAQPGRGGDADFALARVRARGGTHAADRDHAQPAHRQAAHGRRRAPDGRPSASIARLPGFRSRRSRARSSSASVPRLSTRCSAQLSPCPPRITNCGSPPPSGR